MKNFILGLFFFSLFGCDYYLVNPHRTHIGVIEAKMFSDDDGFKVCYNEKIFPYYYGRSPARFTSGKDTLRQMILDQFNNNGYTSISGYVTIRFIINCKGEIGRFRTEEVGIDFKKVNFNDYTVNHLLDIVRSLEDWTPIEFADANYDSFYHITFKIINGEIVEILP
ncbi:MAG: hypothetical protein HKO66_01170 [Saprospiraceae bacterium]|nr:hypothetical protein [Bacteroidia bacterium]NNE14866.1 hypothetical protein [Saprospiraceae bacterium]NNL90819.1 hypothetical protein [Saprospiraceae bacterium]